MPPTAVLSGYVILTSYMLSPSVVTVPGTSWEEPVLVWLTICMPTGSGKSVLFKRVNSLLQTIRKECGLTNKDPSWTFDDATFEKMGSMMFENHSRLLGFYDELSAFLTKINLFRGRTLTDSHEFLQFLQLYNGHRWRKDTGNVHTYIFTDVLNICTHIQYFNSLQTNIKDSVWTLFTNVLIILLLICKIRIPYSFTLLETVVRLC